MLYLVLGACGGAKTVKPPENGAAPSGETATADPEALVNASCIMCHGNNLEGKSGPALNKVGGHLSEAEIHDVIVNGKPGMPGGLLKGADAEAVAKWLAAKK